ncbi:MAG: DUF2877 domain-containing protein [Anaerolineales bacterium]|nr:DUF2877 domain-containing protein [Anaerolineales bacterium]
MEKIHITTNNFTPRVQRWLQKSQAATLLHLFDRVINLIDADGEIISVVQTQIQPGPFSMVVEEERPFPNLISPHAHVNKTATSLTLGPLQIDCRGAELWQPVPDWQQLRKRQADWLDVLPQMETAVHAHLNTLGSLGPTNFNAQFQAATAKMKAIHLEIDQVAWQTAVAHLAGLGPGFTPAGDDFLLGFLFGLWATRPRDEVLELATIVVETAVPRTTQLSAAWLQAAGQGEAHHTWHKLTQTLLANANWETPLQHILQTGATSGAVALLGFIMAAQNQ